MTTPEAKPKKGNPSGLFGQIFGYVLVAATLATGVPFWKLFIVFLTALGMPLIIILAVWWLLRKFARPPLNPYIPALAIQAGHMLSFVVVAISADQFPRLAPDIILMAVGAIWLALRPGRLAIICLIAYQTISILINIWQMVLMSDAVHVFAGLPQFILRGLAIWFMAVTLKDFAQRNAPSATQPDDAKPKDAHISLTALPPSKGNPEHNRIGFWLRVWAIVKPRVRLSFSIILLSFGLTVLPNCGTNNTGGYFIGLVTLLGGIALGARPVLLAVIELWRKGDSQEREGQEGGWFRNLMESSIGVITGIVLISWGLAIRPYTNDSDSPVNFGGWLVLISGMAFLAKPIMRAAISAWREIRDIPQR